MSRKLTPELHQKLLDLRAKKTTFPKIAQELGIHLETAKRYARIPIKVPKEKRALSGVVAGPVYAKGYRDAIYNLYASSGRRYAAFFG